jgi:hypothetical protein
MAFCTKCGRPNTDGALVCTSCGAPLRNPSSPPQVAGPPIPPAYGAPPSAPPTPPQPGPQAMPQAGASYYAMPAAAPSPNVFSIFWQSLDLGARIAGIGGLVAAIAFFLPLYPDANGVNLANGAGDSSGDPAWWFRLVFALLAIALLYFVFNNDLRTKIIVGAAQCALGAAWGLAVFRIASGGDYTSGLQFGWYALHLSFMAILVGGFLSVLHYTSRLAGVK